MDRQVGSAVWTAVAVACVSATAVLWRPGTEPADLTWVGASFLGGIGALYLAARSRPDAFNTPVPTTTALTPPSAVWTPVVVGAGLLLVVAAAGGRARLAPQLPYWAQALLLYGGTACTVWGLAGAPRWRPHRPSSDVCREVGVVLALTALAVGLRVWGLASTLRVSIDEANSVSNLLRLWLVPNGSLTAPPSDFSTSLLFHQWQAFAADMAGPSLTSLRLASALVGSATVAALYLLARVLFDRQTAVVAALLLATFPPHVHFSRIALPHIADPLCGTIAAAGIALGFTRNRRIDWAVAGAALGATQYFFEAGRLFFAPLLLFWVAVTWAVQGTAVRTRSRGVAALGIAAALVALPALGATLVGGHPLLPRWSVSGANLSAGWTTGIGGAANGGLHRLAFAASVYVHQPELAVFYGGLQALVVAPLAPVFLFGLGALLVAPRGLASLLPLWLAAAVVSNALLRESAMYPRWVVATPAAALVMAVGVRRATVLLLPRARPLVVNALALTLAAAVSIGQAWYYFGPHLALLNVQARAAKPYRDALDAALRAAETFPDGTDVIVVSDPVTDQMPPREFLRFLRGEPPVMTLQARRPDEIDDAFLSELPAGRHRAFFLEPHDTATVAALRRRFDVDLGPAQPSPYPIPADKALILYFVSADAIRRPDGR